MHKVFTYGTLQELNIQRELFGRLLKGSPDKLKGYQKETILLDGRTYPILVPDNTHTPSVINGVCYNLTNEDLYCCDVYEGLEYKRIEVILDSGTLAWVYVSA